MTIKDASLPPTVDEFGKDFVGYPLISLLDLFSGYDQCSLALESRDIPAFMTLFGLMWMATLLQRYTNGVQVFDWVICKVLQEQIAQGRAKAFINNVGIKPLSRRSYQIDGGGEFEEVLPVVRKYIMEAIVSLDETLADID